MDQADPNLRQRLPLGASSVTSELSASRHRLPLGEISATFDYSVQPPAAGREQRDKVRSPPAAGPRHRLPLGASSVTRDSAPPPAAGPRHRLPLGVTRPARPRVRHPAPPAAGRIRRDYEPLLPPRRLCSCHRLPLGETSATSASNAPAAGRGQRDAHNPYHRLPLGVSSATPLRGFGARICGRPPLPPPTVPVRRHPRLTLNGPPPPAAGRLQRDRDLSKIAPATACRWA